MEEAEELCLYWKYHPPAHVVLRQFGEYFGAWDPAPESIAEPTKPIEYASEADILGSLAMFQNAMGHGGTRVQ